MKKKTILVPDIHGRTFWLDILPFVDECERIIFLGDYHDPYPDEGILPFDSIQNFNDIINFTKSNRDKVTLLLGNHDLTYYNRTGSDSWNVRANRVDYNNYPEVCKLFQENSDLFDIIAIVNMVDENRVFLISHAGVHPLWITDNKLINNYKYTETSAEEIYKNIDNQFKCSVANHTNLMTALGDIGFSRGGYCDAGSIVWADCHEFLFGQQTPYTQIFGHTQQLVPHLNEDGSIEHLPGKPFIAGENVCIDCHKCFYIDEEGTIRDLKTDEEIY